MNATDLKAKIEKIIASHGLASQYCAYCGQLLSINESKISKVILDSRKYLLHAHCESKFHRSNTPPLGFH